jgi:hypothetical protein
MGHFGAVMIVGFEWVRLSMSVDERLRVIGVSLVQVLLRHRRGEDKPRRQGEREDHTAQPSRHALIMHAIAAERYPVRHLASQFIYCLGFRVRNFMRTPSLTDATMRLASAAGSRPVKIW